MSLLKTNHDGYYKDETTGAVINNNEDEYRLYISQREQFHEFSRMKTELKTLSSEVDQIKKLLGRN